LINFIEKARTPLRFLGSNYAGGGAPEILERLKKVSRDGVITFRENPIGTNGPQTENSSRAVMGAPEFSSRALVP
jgi:hypothetical protein